MSAARRGLALTVGLFLTLLPWQAQAQDPAKALGGFLQNLLKVPAAPAAPANVAPAAAPSPAGGNDLLSLLTQSLDQIDEPREVEIGRNLASILLGAKPLHPDMALQRYVNRLGRWISLHSERPQLPWTFGVLDDKGYNAFAAPGGYIFVTKGLVDSVADEAELAGILAHEIIHVVQKHHLQAMRKSAQTGLLARLAASQLKGDSAGLSAGLINLGRDIYSRGLDQADEFESDRAGVTLATRAGFDPYGLMAVLQQLRSATPDNPMFALALSTHPSTQSRLDLLELAMGRRLDSFTGKPTVSVAQRVARGAR